MTVNIENEYEMIIFFITLLFHICGSHTGIALLSYTFEVLYSVFILSFYLKTTKLRPLMIIIKRKQNHVMNINMFRYLTRM